MPKFTVIIRRVATEYTTFIVEAEDEEHARAVGLEAYENGADPEDIHEHDESTVHEVEREIETSEPQP